MLLGLLVTTGERERIGLAASLYAVASLLRPEGALYAATAAAYIAWRWRDPRRVALFAAVWATLFAPFVVWRLIYYHSWFPNTYYAKSASLAWWSQGWWYTSCYFGIYAIVTACLVATGIAWGLAGRRRRANGVASHGDRRPYDLALLGGAQILLTVLYVTRVGGDFMFARFYV